MSAESSKAMERSRSGRFSTIGRKRSPKDSQALPATSRPCPAVRLDRPAAICRLRCVEKARRTVAVLISSRYAKRATCAFTVGDGAAFCHSLNGVSGTKTDGQKIDMWWRATVCFEKAGGKWCGHARAQSVPFDQKTARLARSQSVGESPYIPAGGGVLRRGRASRATFEGMRSFPGDGRWIRVELRRDIPVCTRARGSLQEVNAKLFANLKAGRYERRAG